MRRRGSYFRPLHVDNFASHPVPILIENDRERYEGKSKESKQGIAPSIAQRFIHCWSCQWQEWAEDETQQVVCTQR